ncbi:hypothetical protein [Pendulispora albinea]|uniref:Uncharacterized protein n=1 Tax=Pendulispora albinea TaxID=2741071 RepID=A0ABZ2M3I6_9BACT
MRIKLLHYGEEWLQGDFEEPPSDRKRVRRFLSAWHHAVDARRGLQLVVLEGEGAGIWDLNGKLLHYAKAIADAAFVDDGLLCLENRVTKAAAGEGIRHAITARSLDTFEVRRTGEVRVPHGCVERLVNDGPSGLALATWLDRELDQEKWGYVGLDARTLQQLPWSLAWSTATPSPPAFVPGGTQVVACHTQSTYWWTDDPDAASPGGLRKVGDITVHDLATNALATYEALIDLPQGWRPNRPDEPEAWMSIWGPEFVDSQRFRIWWPDESSDVLSLPLPPTIVLSRPLGTTRNTLPDP